MQCLDGKYTPRIAHECVEDQSCSVTAEDVRTQRETYERGSHQTKANKTHVNVPKRCAISAVKYINTHSENVIDRTHRPIRPELPPNDSRNKKRNVLIPELPIPATNETTKNA